MTRLHTLPETPVLLQGTTDSSPVCSRGVKRQNPKRYDHYTAARPDTRSTDQLHHDTGGPSRGIVDAHE
jgi:hypothetical protein